MRVQATWCVAAAVIVALAAFQIPATYAENQDKDKQGKPKNVQEVGSCKLTFPAGDDTCTSDPKGNDLTGGFLRSAKSLKQGSYDLEITKKGKAAPGDDKAPTMPMVTKIECKVPYELDASKDVAGGCKADFSQKLNLFIRDSAPAPKQPAGTEHADFKFVGKLKVENGTPEDTKDFTGKVLAPQTPDPEQPDKIFVEETKDNKTLTGSVTAAAGTIIKGNVIVNGELTVTFTAASKEALIFIRINADPIIAVLSDP